MTYLNGQKRAETVIDNRAGLLNLDEIEKSCRSAKDFGLSKIPVHLCHLEELAKAYRAFKNQPKDDWRRTKGI